MAFLKEWRSIASSHNPGLRGARVARGNKRRPLRNGQWTNRIARLLRSDAPREYHLALSLAETLSNSLTAEADHAASLSAKPLGTQRLMAQELPQKCQQKLAQNRDG